MVGGVALGGAAAVVGPVAGVVGCERAQPERGEQRAAADLDDAARRLVVERAVRERHGEQLVRAHGGVVALRAVDDVEQARAVGRGRSGA